MTRSDQAPIRFGTSGWRGVLADDFTLARARAAVRGVGRWLAEDAPGARVVVAYDTRFLGERFAAMAVHVLRACGARPLLAKGPTATPVVARAVLRRRAAAGVIFTASHNPPEYQGVKVLERHGGSAGPEQTRRIEAHANRALLETEEHGAERAIRAVDLVEPYLADLARRVDVGILRRARLGVVYDAMHGAGSGVLDVCLARAGVQVERLRADPDPRFGGGAPDPVPARLASLVRHVRKRSGLRIGLATDGDADRYGVVDADGSVLSETEALALLVDHLARTGRVRRGVAISVATGSLVERVASAHGLAVTRHPIGFKHLAAALAAGSSDVAGEESAGFAWSPFCRDKDGILAGCLFAEIVALTRAPLARRLRDLARAHGASRCARLALPGTPGLRRALEALCANPPERLGGARVVAATTRDGLRLQLGDGFVMLRGSGTEPVIRVYAEAPDARGLERRLRAGTRLLDRASR